MYLDSKLSDKQKKQKLGNVSTVCVVDYDKENGYFVLGLRDVMSREKIIIDLHDYMVARTNRIYPYSPCKYICVIERYEKHENYTLKNLSCFFEQQMWRFSRNDSLELLLESIKKDMKKENKRNREILNIQCNILHSSFALGSNSFLYYEYANAINEYGFWDAKYLAMMENAGVIIRKATREFARIRDINEIKGIVALEKEISKVIKIKQTVCEGWNNEKVE